MKNKRLMYLILLLLLTVGFATVSTSLFLGGSVNISTNKNDFDVYFSGAELDNIDVSDEVIKDKKHLVYESNELKKINDKSVLKYEVANDSNMYDANVTISCTPMKTNFIEVTLDPVNLEIKAGEYKTGEIEVKLIKPVSEEQNVMIDCTLEVNAIEREKLNNIKYPFNDFSIEGYLLNEDGKALSNAYLAICSNENHIVKTDLYGYFYVDGLERGMHEIYYLNTLDPTSMDKNDIKLNKKSELKISANSTGNLKLSNGLELKNLNIKREMEQNIYEIALDPMDDNMSTQIIEVIEHEYYPSLPTITKKGYTFKGWYLNDNIINENVYVKADKPHTLKAKWGVNEYTVTFDANGGSVDVTTMDVIYDSPIGKLPECEREGYTFAGWFYNEKEYNKDSLYDEDVNITLKAKWTPKTYTVSFDAVGGNKPADITVTFGEPYGTLPTSIKTGYTLQNWSLDGYIITSDTIVDTPNDVELTAVWSGNLIEVTCYHGDNYTRSYVLEVKYGEPYGELKTTTTASGLMSNQYTLNSTSGSLVTSDTIVTTASDHNIYCKYTNYGFSKNYITTSNISSSGFDVNVKLNKQALFVQFPTWTNNNGQDDMDSNWSTSTKSRGSYVGNNTYYFHVNTSDHNNEKGLYIVDIYACSSIGNGQYVGETKVTVP